MDGRIKIGHTVESPSSSLVVMFVVVIVVVAVAVDTAPKVKVGA
jgi:hypothetical protein